ncbi:MAG TPA: isoprenylcysteine carboxylmethyltransferase family protein [Gemmatimonadales bacterium]|nr:isoprenylcysteine carboxylmethyltransferase family protein [Gemmatimonadales bacterium]
MKLANAARDRWVRAQAVLLLAVALMPPLLPRFASLGPLDVPLNRIDPWRLRLAGVAVGLAGLAFAAWGVRTLGPALTPATEPLPGAPLARSGPYAVVRHPIYLGLVAMLAGWTLVWSNWTLALVVAGAAAAFFEAKAKVEERWLSERHPEYAEYVRRVRRRVVWTGT